MKIKPNEIKLSDETMDNFLDMVESELKKQRISSTQAVRMTLERIFTTKYGVYKYD